MSSDGQRAKFPQNYRGRPSFTSVSLLVDEIQLATSMPTILFLQKIHQGVEYFQLFWRAEPKRRFQSLPATKNHQGLGDSEDESNAKILSVPESETCQQSSPHIHLKLMRRQPQQENANRVLVENNFDTASVTWRSKFSTVLLQRYLQVHN